MLTIIMYHYVRDLPASRFPRIMALRTGDFERQLDHIAANFHVVGQDRVAAAYAGHGQLPDNACWLTFDDGFADHFETVFPRLTRRGLSASFFPMAWPARTGQLVDTHRIHFILAGADDPHVVYDALLERLTAERVDVAALKDEYLVPNRFDGPEVNFVKRVLQVGLARPIRSALCGELFARFVTRDEVGFAGELYMTIEQMRAMAAAGMHFGGHGFRHDWLASMSEAEQAEEIAGSVELVEQIHGRRPPDMCISYPYGSYNDVTLRLARQAGFALGLNTKVGTATLSTPPLELPRLDTNDVPR